jgi:formylglycine-generating enzyme required for sulfatase activity
LVLLGQPVTHEFKTAGCASGFACVLIATQACSAGQSAPHARDVHAEYRPELIAVPEGTFWMGYQNERFHEDEPWHRARVHSFEIDSTEVTVAQYRHCVLEKKCTAAATELPGEAGAGERFWSDFCNAERPGRDEHPINCVTWHQAHTFCEWTGKRLPTEEEWEYAARGSDGRKYPWGNEAAGPQYLNGCDTACIGLGRSRSTPWHSAFDWTDGYADTAPVASFPRGRSPFGLYDMAGNVEEWTASSYAAGSQSGASDRRVVRGGGWNGDRAFETGHRGASEPTMVSPTLGFRCAR